ncbi:MAG: family 16 glycoside hydrolase [Pirellulaceae bacterium]
MADAVGDDPPLAEFVPTTGIPPPQVLFGSPWHIEGDQLVHAGGDGEQWLVFGDPNWRDIEFTYEFFVQGRNSISTLFHVTGPSQATIWGTGWFRQGNFAILQHANNTTLFDPLVRAKPSISTQQNQWHTARTLIRHRSVQCFVNDFLVWEFDQLPYSHGRVGLRFWNREGDQTVRVRNIHVKDGNGEILWYGLPELDKNECTGRQCGADTAN